MTSNEERAEKLLEESKTTTRHTTQAPAPDRYLDQAISEMDSSIDLGSDQLRHLVVALGLERLEEMDEDEIQTELETREL